MPRHYHESTYSRSNRSYNHLKHFKNSSRQRSLSNDGYSERHGYRYSDYRDDSRSPAYWYNMRTYKHNRSITKHPNVSDSRKRRSHSLFEKRNKRSVSRKRRLSRISLRRHEDLAVSMSRHLSKENRNRKQSDRPASPKATRRTWKFDSPPRDEQFSTTTDGKLDVTVLGLSSEQQKAARELYVGNLPPNLDVNQLIDFFNAAMLTINSSGIPGNPVSRAWIAADGHFAFVELRTIEEATIALQLNGLNCMGYTLRIGRPKTYPVEYSALLTSTHRAFSADLPNPAAAFTAAAAAAASVELGGINPSNAILTAQLAAAGLGIIRKPVVEKPCRLIMLDLPPQVECTEDKVKEMIRVHGNLRAFQYFEVPLSEKSEATGVCIFEYSELGAQKALTEAIIKDKTWSKYNVRVMPADQTIQEEQLAEAMEKAGIKQALGGDLMRPQIPTKVIMLSNIVTQQELLDNQEYADIIEDISIECAQFGKVLAVEVPRPVENNDHSAVGYAFIKFSKLQEAGIARKALSGRKFASRTVEAHYFNEKKFEEKEFQNPQPNFDLTGRLIDDTENQK